MDAFVSFGLKIYAYHSTRTYDRYLGRQTISIRMYDNR